MKHQIRLFFTALQFYTRIPIPDWVEYSAENLSPAIRYLPLIGWLAGLVAFMIFWAGSYLTSVPTGIILSMISTILLTGAFHEDGFADACDGFGGGWTREKILLIMKDSRIGTYGAAGLILILSLKFSLIFHLVSFFPDQFLVFSLVLINAHTLSRFMAATVIFTTSYARDTDDSKVKPVAQKTGSETIWTAALLTLIPLLILIFFTEKPVLFFLLLPIYVFKIAMTRYFVKWIGGYTGDCLGAVQQVCEIGIYFLLAAIWKFI